VPVGAALGPGIPNSGAGEHNERFAMMVEGDRAEVLSSYELCLIPLLRNSGSREQALANGADIIDDVVTSIRSSDIRIDHYKLHTWNTDETGAMDQLSPAIALRAAVMFHNITSGVLVRHVNEDPALLPCFLIGILALNESINRRIREATLTYRGYLLKRIHRAHLDERLRIARELHDRLGEGVSAALRQVELHELSDLIQPAAADPHTSLAKDALTASLHDLRQVTSELRQEPVTNLEKALTSYISSLPADVDVRLRVNGDESWASPDIIDEVFMIIREALRNALAHGAPRLVLIGIDLAPHELHAWVEDDGIGFTPRSSSAPSHSDAMGLAAMRERATLIGGNLIISSELGQGTEVELLVPLLESHDERREQ
jgi:signal transduction histidine kinase